MTTAMPTIVALCTRPMGVYRAPIPGEAPEPSKPKQNPTKTKKPQAGRPPNTRMQWDCQHVAMLGTVSDKELGRRIGVSGYTVRDERMRRKIPAFAQMVIQWDDQKIKMLGTDTDIKISARLGVSKASVAAKRKALGIKPYAAHKSNSPKPTAQKP